MNESIRQQVRDANLQLVSEGLVRLTWGNASAIDRDRGVIWIKPSGVSYDEMTPDDMVEVDLHTGRYNGPLRPSSDTPTHLQLYQSFPEIGAVIHTHSHWATVWAQACREIPCLGTTHADHFYGPVPLTRWLSDQEIQEAYELHTGKVIAERFQDENPMDCPGVLVAGHGPFTWGRTPAEAVRHAIILEEIARMAFHTLRLGKETPISQVLQDKHFGRKHGPGKYYGQ